jgi:hypothetical protein
MSSLWTGLLFLHGHIHDPELARRLANTPDTPPPSRRSGKRRRMYSPLAVFASLCARMCVGIGESRKCAQ